MNGMDAVRWCWVLSRPVACRGFADRFAAAK
jgi:hypothetical protein